jgi:hypothetical protein
MDTFETPSCGPVCAPLHPETRPRVTTDPKAMRCRKFTNPFLQSTHDLVLSKRV